jgi:hypothetical protein
MDGAHSGDDLRTLPLTQIGIVGVWFLTSSQMEFTVCPDFRRMQAEYHSYRKWEFLYLT